MGYTLYSFDSVLIPQQVGTTGMMDIGGGHLTSRPNISGTGIVHHPLIGLPGGQSFDPVAGSVAPRSSMDVSAKVILLGQGATLKSAVDTWLSRLGKRSTLIRQGDDGSLYSVMARLIVADINRGYINRQYLPIDLTWTVTGLPWSGTSRVFPLIDLGTDSTEDVSTTGADSGVSPFTFYFYNGGNVTQSNVVFTFNAVGGTISSVTVTNVTNGCAFNYAAIVGSGHTLVIDCGALSVVNNGINDYVHFTPPTNFEDWFELVPGNNQITFAVTASSGVTGQITWADAWN